jgi:hypothetical protein
MPRLVLIFFARIIRSSRDIADMIPQNRGKSPFFEDVLPLRDLGSPASAQGYRMKGELDALLAQSPARTYPSPRRQPALTNAAASPTSASFPEWYPRWLQLVRCLETCLLLSCGRVTSAFHVLFDEIWPTAPANASTETPCSLRFGGTVRRRKRRRGSGQSSRR